MTADLFKHRECRTVVFSECRQWRYVLEVVWNEELPVLSVIGLNPSTADEEKNDPTVSRCISRARRNGYGGLCMLNLFGWRSTDPQGLQSPADPVGSGNDSMLVEHCRGRDVMCAWGVLGVLKHRNLAVLDLIRPVAARLLCLGTTNGGHPRHPLYVASATALVEF